MFDLKNPLFRFGIGVSVAWLAIGICLMAFVGNWSGGIKPNEWGDVFAGMAAPMAFLWLVLGFIQQGQELKLSTDALKLQAAELKNAVEQHRQLVEVSREQVEASLRREREEHRLRRLNSQPAFALYQAGITPSHLRIRYDIGLRNEGGQATNVNVSVEGFEIARSTFPVVRPGAEVTIRLSRPADPEAPPTNIHITYLDQDKAENSVDFVGHYIGNNLTFEMTKPPLIS